jgi:parallel beta-helix repeat protein
MKSNIPEHPAHSRLSLIRRYTQSDYCDLLYYTGCIIIYILFYLLPVTAQPSGGPYGPVSQTYDVPKNAGKIFYVAPDGIAEAPGNSLDKPTTLKSAIERVTTGDVIIMRGGTYRTGELLLNQGIIIQPYADEKPVLKGTLVANQWERLRNGLWKTSWSRLFPSRPADWWVRQSHGRETPLHRFNNDMLFVDGKFLQSAGWEGEIDENSYFIDYDAGLIFLNIDPTDRLVEITAFKGAIRRTTGKCHGKSSDRKGPLIRGITFTQYAYCAVEIEGTDPEGLSEESKHGKEVVGTVLENCNFSFCSRVAAYLRGDHLTIRHCRVSDTSTEGIYILSSSDVLLEKNIFTRNNIENITGYFPAAVKIFNQCYRVTCRDNLVIDLPNSNGIWYDVGNVDGYFLNNWVEGVGYTDRKFSDERFWPSDNGFFFEISKGAVCAGNVFVNCDQGIYLINSSDVQIYNNTLVNSTVSIVRTARSAEGDHFGWHPSTGPDVDERDGHVFVNNLLTGDENYHRPLLAFWQPPSLCERLNKPQVKQLDYNVYVQGEGNASQRLILWSPAQNPACQVSFKSPDDLRQMNPQFSANSRYFPNYSGPLFKSSELGNYQLLQAFPGYQAASRIPFEIKKLLGLSEKDTLYTGAYPPLP